MASVGSLWKLIRNASRRIAGSNFEQEFFGVIVVVARALWYNLKGLLVYIVIC